MYLSLTTWRSDYKKKLNSKNIIDPTNLKSIKRGRVRQWKESVTDMRGSCVVSGLNYLTPLCLG